MLDLPGYPQCVVVHPPDLANGWAGHAESWELEYQGPVPAVKASSEWVRYHRCLPEAHVPTITYYGSAGSAAPSILP